METKTRFVFTGDETYEESVYEKYGYTTKSWVKYDKEGKVLRRGSYTYPTERKSPIRKFLHFVSMI